MLICHTLPCLSTFNQMFINHMCPVSTQTSRHTFSRYGASASAQKCVRPPVVIVPLLWHMWHLPHTRPARTTETKWPCSTGTSAAIQNTDPKGLPTVGHLELFTEPGEEGHIKTLKQPYPPQTPPKTCNSDTVTLSVLGIQELISHRLAYIFICCVKHKHSNTLLRCTSKLPFLPLPLTADSPRCRPALPRYRCTACRKKDSTSLALRAASRCENKPMVRRRDEERGRRREGGGRKEERRRKR